jgi:ubiquinone/menaquinone biosynthesis C-methylase UbiE
MSELLDEYYRNNYTNICNNGSIGIISRIIHLLIENSKIKGKRIKVNKLKNQKILEVGAGNGQHKPYVKNYVEYIETDLRPENLPPPKNKFNEMSIDCTNLPFQDSYFDRLIATCLLVHLNNPEKALEEWRRVVRNEGVISIYIPCEPGVLLRFFQTLTTRRKQKRFSDDPYYLHYLDHKSHYVAMKSFILHEFGKENIQNTRYPFNFLTWNFNLFAIITVLNKK